MEALFLQIVNVGIMAGWIVLAVLLLRLCLKKAPRWITCLLWGLVALRLILPVSLESALSLIPSEQTVPSDITTMETPSIHTGVTVIDRPLNEMLQTVVPTPPAQPSLPSTDPAPSTPPSGQENQSQTAHALIETAVTVGAWVWLAGVVGMVLYGLFSIWQVRRRVLDAVHLRENIWQSDRIATPFILGVFRPRIYLPYQLGENTVEQVLFHERAHLHRRDHWIKPFSFFLLSVYWFNPLLWVAYILLCRDIEVACDQRVLLQLPEQEHKQYAFALLECGAQRRTIAACPLAFGEVGVKQRIKNVLHYRKPLLWVVIASLLVCSVAAVCLLTVPPVSDESQSDESQSDESQNDESQSDESQSDESQGDESQGDESQSHESQSDESQRDESRRDESQESDKTNSNRQPSDDASDGDEAVSGSIANDNPNEDTIDAINVADVVDRSKEEAISTLEEQGFNVVVLEEYHYSVEKGVIISQSPDANTLQLPGSNIIIYVSKGWQTATVTYDACGGDVSPSKETYKLTDPYGSLPVPTRIGYTFTGWYTEKLDGTQITESTKITDPSAYTLYAHWDANNYVVSFDSNGGSEAPADRSVTFGSAYGDLGTVSKEGFDFQGWFTAAEGGIKVTNDSLVARAKNHTLFAQWDVAVYEYTILYRSCNGTDLGSTTVSYQHGTTNTITPPDFNGYQTPLGRVIRCDTTSERTITFVYDPYEEGYAKTVDRGVWYAEGDKDILRYEVNVQCQNRTENSVEIRVTWTNSIIGNHNYAYKQNYNVYVNGYLIVEDWLGPFNTPATGAGAGKGRSTYWITIPLSTTEQHEITFEGEFWDSKKRGRWSGTFTVPAY